MDLRDFWGRIKTAANAFRDGRPEQKALFFGWPNLRADKPQWHLVDITSYINEGFNANTIVYSAIMFKVKAMIPAPLKAYQGDPRFPEPVEADHPLALRVANPNEHQTFVEFHAQNVVFLNIAGEVFLYRDPKDGSTYSLRPDRVYIVPTSQKVPAGIKGYLYVPEGTGILDGVPIPSGDMFHIKLPNPGDPLEGMGYGLSPLSPAAHATDVDNMVTEFLHSFFKRGAMLTGLLKFKSALSEQTCDEIRARWAAKYGGYDKWGVGVLDRGGEYERLALTFEEMGFEELDGRNESRIAMPFGVPLILIGAKLGLLRSTYANYGEARKAVWQDTLWPEMCLFGVEYGKCFHADDAFVKFDTSQVPAMQLDIPPLAGAAYRLWMMGMPAKDALQVVGIPCRDFPGGDVPRPMNLAGGDPGGLRLPAGDGDDVDGKPEDDTVQPDGLH